MKRFLLILLVMLLSAGALAEEQATLTFSSFDGGGYEYSVDIEDPTILACDVLRDYGEGDHSLETGSAYTMTFTFMGLKPGTTTVTVYGRSPILENDDALYTATVDESLNVTLIPERALSTFYLYRTGDISYDSYYITRWPDGYRVSINEEANQLIDSASVVELTRVIDEYGLAQWDGFDETRTDILDGESFWLEFSLTDGTRVLAQGDNAYPENYSQAMDDIQAIFDSAQIGADMTTGIPNEWEEKNMKLTIGGTEVPVTWEENASTEALKALLPLTIEMSMYGGFEQVGPIGQSIVRDDSQTTTSSGDIVLYAGNQIVVFYGSNSWAYTRLGHVNLTADEMRQLLSNGDVTITIEEG